jgi:RNA polymerase sigma factor (sigma-70 family)
MALMEEDRVVSLVRENAASLLRLARKHSLCEDDAADACQRTLEIYLERVERIDHATAGAWLRTVCKHEAMRLRAARQRVLTPEAVEWDLRPSDVVYEGPERAEALERVARAAEALQGCTPDEARAMLLRADGSSYAEISAQCGWSYSKVNRSLAEGRARFLRRFARIESGEACAGYLPALSAIVDGEATPRDFLALRPHLRHCSGCRATLKAMYESEPVLGALVPAGALVLAAPGPLSRAFSELGERVVRLHACFEAASASKAVAVVASTAAVAAGGAAAVEHSESRRPLAPVAAHVAHVAHVARVRAARPTITPAASAPSAATVAPTAVASPAASAPSATPEATAAATAAVPEFTSVQAAVPRSHRLAAPADLGGPEALPRAAAPARRLPARSGRSGSEFAVEGGG